MTEKLAPRVAALEKGHAELRRNIQVIEGDIAKINARLDETATKSDVANAKMEITAEFNLGINGILRDALAADGFEMAPLNVNCGSMGVDEYVDLPPYRMSPSLKIRLGQYITTSIGLIVRRPARP